jgi:hypothetical protein
LLHQNKRYSYGGRVADQGGDSPTGGPGGIAGQLGTYAIRALPAVAGAVGFVGFVAVLGAAVDWVRFYAAGLPSDQAVSAIARRELVATGTVSLVSFMLLGGAAVLLARLLDPHARNGLRIGVSVLVLVELCLVLAFATGDTRPVLWATVLIACVALLVFAHSSVCTLDESRDVRTEARLRRDALRPALNRVHVADAALAVAESEGDASSVAAARRRRIPALVELQTLLDSEVPVSDARRVAESELASARAGGEARLRCRPTWTGWIALVLAVPLLVTATDLIVRREALHWTGVMLLFVLALNAAVYGAWRTGWSFVWYGLALFASVPLFGAVLAAERTYHTPKLQPVALIRESSNRAICGVYIGENDDRVYIARVEPKARHSPLAAHGTGRMFWIPKADVDIITVGQLQGIRDANRRAPQLAYELYADRAENPSIATRPTRTTRTRTRGERGSRSATTRVVAIEHAGRIVRPRPKYEGRRRSSCTSERLRVTPGRRPSGPRPVSARSG